MPELELIRQGKHQDKDIFFCHFNHRAEGEIRVVVTAQTLSEFNKDCGCDDLVKICRYAAEEAIHAGLKGDIELVSQIYLAVKRRLRSDRT
jgi:hypothetical protein